MSDTRSTPIALPRLTAAEAASFSGPACIVRVSSADDVDAATRLDPDRVAWLEVALSLIEHEALQTFRVDIRLDDPATEAARLYTASRIRGNAPTRITIPAIEGVARAGQVAMAVQLPVRIVPIQPAPAVVAELEALLERYLHDPQARAPVEPFHGALARLLHGDESTLWRLTEHDPAEFPGAADERYAAPLPNDPTFVRTHLARLVAEGAECATCPLQTWCAGWFKWPDPAYDCTSVRRLFDALETSARQLRAHVSELDAP